MRRGRRPWLALALPAVLLAFSGCTPLFVPPVPATIAVRSRMELDRSSRLWWDGDRLRLDLVFAEVPRSGWLAVQWLTPAGVEVASDSTWVMPDDAGGGRSLYAPPGLTRSPGRWQALVSFGPELVRQLSTAADPG